METCRAIELVHKTFLPGLVEVGITNHRQNHSHMKGYYVEFIQFESFDVMKSLRNKWHPC
jgi:hypothetical protein